MHERVILYVITVLSLSSQHSNAESADFGTVIFANVLFRHGDRTPRMTYPNDPYDESMWPVPFGELTNIGKRQQLELGRWLRKRYMNLLPERYSFEDIYVRSTDVDRTLMSAQANLAEIEHFCPRYQSERAKVQGSWEIQLILRANRELFAYLTNETGTVIDDFATSLQLYDTLFIQDLYNKTLPEWTKSVYPGKLKFLGEMWNLVQVYNKVLRRLRSGPLLGEMAKHMAEKARNALIPNRKLWVYSAHDTTVFNVLITLGLLNPHMPPYSATFLMELRVNSENQHLVTLSYKNSSAEPAFLTLSGCSTLCPLNQFMELTEHLIPKNLEKECALDDAR